MAIRTIKDVDLKNKRVIFRVAYDITLKKEGDKWIVPDDARIRATLPTLFYLLENDCKIIILSWLKRPGGKIVEEYRMDPVAHKLEELIGKLVKKLDDCVGPKVEKEVEKMKPGEIIMLENVRFHPGEEKDDPDFATQLARLGELVVFDAFGQAHRIHASTTGLLKLLPSVAGLLMEKEVETLTQLNQSPKKPFVAILGGAKISDKVKVIKSLILKADVILIVGALANTFLKAQGKKIGASVAESTDVDVAKGQAENDWLALARRLLAESEKEKVKFDIHWDLKKMQLPFDLIAGSEISESAGTEVVDLEKDQVQPDWLFLDIGPKTTKLFGEIIRKAGTVFWNGPAGYFELDKFAQGTREIAQAIIESKAASIIGGGDTEKIVKKFGLSGKFTHVSTGGGASLALLAGEELPALELLPNK